MGTFSLLSAIDLIRFNGVSIQLMSPASGDLQLAKEAAMACNVSIQLMSPASGDLQEVNFYFSKFPIPFPFN